MKVVCVIPAYNESKFIKKVVQSASKYVDLVIVADDNSHDGTAALAKKSGAFVLSHNTTNWGVGKNTWHGIETALIGGADIVVTLDGDGQHNPDEIPLLLKPILENRADLVIGSRFTNYQEIPLYRRFGISVITYLYNIFNASKVGDSQSGFRAYNRKILESIPTHETNFGFIIEYLVRMRAKHFRYTEVPITCIYHKNWRLNSTINPLKHGLLTVYQVLKWRFLIEVLKKN